MGEEIQCKRCSMMIPQESWKCPCCEKLMCPSKKYYFFIIIGLFIAFAILNVFNSPQKTTMAKR